MRELRRLFIVHQPSKFGPVPCGSNFNRCFIAQCPSKFGPDACCPDFFHFRPADGLFIGNDSKRFECGLGKSLFGGLTQMYGHGSMISAFGEKLVATGYFHQLERE